MPVEVEAKWDNIIKAQINPKKNKKKKRKLLFRNFPYILKAKTEVPRDVRNSKVRRQDKFRRDWSQH